MASSDTRIESATLKRKLALEKMHEIEKNIEETETVRAERDKYWNDLISKETEKRNVVAVDLENYQQMLNCYWSLNFPRNKKFSYKVKKSLLYLWETF
ncbi:unnamed protein product [Rotaria magnacalcarata]|uniref:Uncharacterized protein n=1 Tax=Rotaria magnacalcarata TaxID=392030 RepID=A0A820A365_9BILA|nr:unnamed protein product [Rotaria magnacalcarata]